MSKIPILDLKKRGAILVSQVFDILILCNILPLEMNFGSLH